MKPSPNDLVAGKAALTVPIEDADDSSDFLDLGEETGVKNLDPNNPNGAWNHIKDEQDFVDPLKKSASESREGCTRIVLMSDTHAKHRSIRAPAGDVLIHAGDFTKMGEPGTIRDLNAFFKEARETFQDVVCIAGNHDITLDSHFYQHNWQSFPHRERGKKPFNEEEIQTYLTDCTYLEDASCHTTNGNLEVYGSPWSPTFGCWAFGMIRGAPIRQVWEKIPASTDVLITHGPPLGRGDLTFHNGRSGCLDLLQEVQNRIRPRLHVFGHIHEDHGCTFDGTTLYVNASSVDLRYQPTRNCIVVDLPHDLDQPARVVQPNCTLTPDRFVEWLESRGFEKLAAYAKEADLGALPSGNDLLGADAHQEVCTVLNLFRDSDARKEWQRAAMILHSESF